MRDMMAGKRGAASASASAAGGGLVRTLAGGPVDVVGDVHGQIDALRDLLGHLGYDEDGDHPRGRRLVFLGDLVDRGPDSVGVLEWVMRLVSSGAAASVLGNHELNLLNDKRRVHNNWFFGRPVPVSCRQMVIDEDHRQRLTAFMLDLPVALEREDLRVVHASWDDAAIDRLRSERDVRRAFTAYRRRIDERLEAAGVADELEKELAHQNENPVKLITSGPESPADEPFEANGKIRHAGRVTWWDAYRGPAFCVFGHYWRNAPSAFHRGPNLFAGYDLHHMQGPGWAMCVDYAVGARGLVEGETRLAALRWPERELVFDSGAVRVIEPLTSHG